LVEIRCYGVIPDGFNDASDNADDDASRAFAFSADAEIANHHDTGADILQLQTVEATPPPPSGPFSKVTSGLPGDLGGAWHGVAWGDFDKDGDLDLFVAGVGTGNRLFRNDAGSLVVVEGVFSETAHSTACAWVDFDNDGDLDLFVTNSGQPHFLYVNNGDGSFTKNATAEITASTGECYGATWGDYNRDGFPDVMIAGAWKPNILYRNNGNGTFTRITEGAIVNDSAGWVGGAWGDFDGDGWPDYFAVSGGDDRSNALYRNNGDGSFTPVSVSGLTTDGGASTSAVWGDYDNDGDLDLFVANRLGSNFLYRNNGNGQFSKIMAGDPVNDGGESNGSAWLDYDNDGWLDLFVGNYMGGQNCLYRNQGDGTFARVLSGPGAEYTDTMGVAVADYTGDGYPDMALAGYGRPNSLYRNNGDTNTWLIVKCVGTRSHAAGLGAKVRVTANTGGTIRTQMREISGGGGWFSPNQRAEFGLGTASTADLVRIEWPSRIVTELRNVPANQVLTVVEQPPPLEITPAGGFFSGTVEVALTARVEGGEVRYTLDGTEPTTGATLYSQPFTLSASTRVLARVFKAGEPASEEVGALFLENRWNDGIPAAWRERYFGGNWFAKPVALALADADNDGAMTIQEWLAETNPADAASKPASPVALLAMTPVGGEFELAAEVRLETPVPGGQIRYTTDGSEPGATSPVAEAVVTLTRSATLKARVFVNGNAVSAVVGASFTVKEIAPRITRQPVSQAVLAGGSVSFEVEAVGTPPLAYQWAFNGTDIAEANGRMLALASVRPEQAGTYTVRVSNALGSVVSEPAVLTVHQRPQILRQPEPVAVVVGQSATFSVEAVGDAPLGYVWFRNGMRIMAAPNAPLFTIAAVTPADAGQYQVRVSNQYGAAASRLVSLTVLPAPLKPTITTQPEGLIRVDGESAALTVAATGTAPLAYQWFFNGQPLAGATEPRVEITSLKLSDAGTYWVVVSNVAGVATSFPAVLEVHPKQRGGTVVFANRVTITDIDAPVYDADGTTRLAGAAFFAQLYAGPAEDQLTPVGWPVPFGEGTRAGYVPSSVVAITTVAPGALAWVQMRAWESARGPSYEAALQAGGKVGESGLVQVTTGGAGDPPSFPAALVGLASFRLLRESEPPVITITLPNAGVTADDRFALAGTVADNAGVALVQWAWNNRTMGVLPLVDGRFHLAGLRLARGENRIRVVATDTAGNAAETEVLVVYEPVRVLALSSPAPVQEGRRLATEVTLASPGGVSGLTFGLRYDAERFRDPEFAWKEAEALAGALTQVNAGTPGEVRATLSLPGGELPAGAFALGTFTLRARSVPEAVDTDLVPDLGDIADRAGAKIEFGNAAEKTVARILPRGIRGDNNANDALDVGDATLMQRLLTQLDPLRSWDHAANDLNASGDLDSGDVTRVLRVVVGLDPAPTPTPPGPALARPTRRPPSLAAAETAAAVWLAADRSQAWPGEVVKFQVRLAQPPAGVSGVSFRLAYPAGALRLLGNAVKTGLAVPAGVSSLLHVDEAAGQVNFAASGTIIWSEAGAVVLEVPFEVLPAGGQTVWAVSLISGQVAWDNGYEVRALAPASLELRSLAPELVSEVEFTGEGVRLAFGTAPGVRYTVEASDDLKTWTPLGTVDGTGQVAGFIDTDRRERAVRFYRVSVAR
jgi:hypothetical protein